MAVSYDAFSALGPLDPLLSDRDALVRLLEFARHEAESQGETVCAAMVAAALVSLEDAPVSAEAVAAPQLDRAPFKLDS
ncbi:MAG: hypothetical protein AAGD34_15065 [Pseudomonadota bacterium]